MFGLPHPLRLCTLRPAGVRQGVWGRMAALAALCLLLALGAPGLPTSAARADTGAPGTIHLTGCIARQLPGDDARMLLNHPNRFDCHRPAAAWGPGNFWIRYTLPAGSSVTAARADEAPRQFRFVPQWQRDLAVITRDADGQLETRWFDDADLSRLVRVGGVVPIPLERGDRPVTDVLIRVDGALNASGLVGDPQVLSDRELDGEELVAVAAIAAFVGLSFGLFCYNIVLWLTIRERFQLTYCLSLLAMLAYVWANSGIMVQQFPAIPHTARLGTSYVMLGFVAALALQFIADFIEPDRLPRQLRRIARQLGLVCVVAGLVVVAAPEQWRHLADRIYVLSFVPLPPMVVTLIVLAWRRGSRSVRVLAVAWLVPVVMTLVRLAHALNFIPFGPLVQYSIVIGMSLEALLSSLAMSFRIKRITEERDQAVADERAARHLANVDSLTGLLNRRALLAQLIAWGSPEPLRLLIVDIDRFKAINDQHGHLVGDEVLRAVAELLAIRADLNASVARLGGEEFALIGTANDLSEAVALGILADIRGETMPGGVRVTVSVGMAEGMVLCEDDWRELYRRADAALYQAKSEGRNRAVQAPPVLPAEAATAAA